MQYCTRCAYPSNHPFGITFDADGVCSGCRVHEEKDELNWDERENKLKNILDAYTNKSHTNYDCIIPVSGGKDSYFIVDLIKNKYKMNPLLIGYNSHYNTLVGLRNLQNLKTVFGCDLFQLNINPDTAKELVRYTFKKFGSIYWHNHAGSTVFPVQMAVKMKIPLIIWGAHQGIDQVGMFSHTDEVEMTRKYRKEHDLMGIEPEDLILEKDCPESIKSELKKYFYPSDEKIKEVSVRGIYLNNYIRWDAKTQHELMIKKFDYHTIKQSRTFNTYEDVHSLVYNDIHDYIKYLKFGYSKVTDHVCQEIRLKRISRDKGLELIKNYQNKEIKFVEPFIEWLDITKEEFWETLNSIKTEVQHNIFEYDIDDSVKKEVNLKVDEDNDFVVNDMLEDFPKLNSFYKGVYL